MFRRSIIWCLILLTISALSGFPQVKDDAVLPEEPLPEGLYIPPYLQNVTQHSIVIMWETTDAVVGTVSYGESEEMERSVTESSPSKIHELEITGLEPGKNYHYQVRYGSVKLDPSTFRTAPSDGTREFRLVAYGDPRSYPGRHRRTVEQIAAANPDLIISAADLTSSGQVYEQWKPQFFMPLRIVSDHIPFFTCLGNHEGNSKHYFNYMSLPGNEVYYSFDYASAHFIALDSDAGYTPYDESSPQYRWLIEDLEAHKNAEWIIVYFHHPLFRFYPNRGIEIQRHYWQPVFDKYGVDLVLAGHDHHYGHTYPVGKVGTSLRKGVRYITTGGGGAPLYDVTTARPYIVTAQKAHNLVIIDFHKDTADAVVKDIDGKVIDRFTINRTQATPPEEYVSYEVFEIERDLRKAILDLEPVVAKSYGQAIEVNMTLTVRTNFGVRLEGDMAWNLPDFKNTWKFDQPSMEFAINPGAELRIPIKASAIYPDIYPVPGLTVNFKKVAGRLPVGFRNRQITLHPIKILPSIPVSIPRIKSINIDGILDEQGVFLADFVTEQADVRPKSKILAKLAHDGANLYVAAEIEASPERINGILQDKSISRDNRNMTREEHFRINLSDGNAVYTFAVDPRGAQMDTRDSDITWNADWLARAEATGTGWLVEMSIPISVFGDDIYKKQWFINIGRRDSGNSEEVLLAPTFYGTDRENRLPEYSTSIKNPKLFPAVTLSDLSMERK